MHLQTTLNQMRHMRLSTMATALERRLRDGEHNTIPTEDFIALLVEDEYGERENRKLARMINAADFKPEMPCLQNIDYAVHRGFTKKDITQFTSETWINNAYNLVLTGPTGSGKTYIAEAIGLQACKMGYSTRKLRYSRLFEELDDAKALGQHLKYLKKLQKTRVLILDDFLMAQTTQEQFMVLLDIIEDRSQMGPTIITTQYPPAQWHKMIQEPTVADAICDRLIPTSMKFHLKGESMRKKSQPK